jgi:hypothetical protein
MAPLWRLSSCHATATAQCFSAFKFLCNRWPYLSLSPISIFETTQVTQHIQLNAKAENLPSCELATIVHWMISEAALLLSCYCLWQCFAVFSATTASIQILFRFSGPIFQTDSTSITDKSQEPSAAGANRRQQCWITMESPFKAFSGLNKINLRNGWTTLISVFFLYQNTIIECLYWLPTLICTTQPGRAILSESGPGLSGLAVLPSIYRYLESRV